MWCICILASFLVQFPWLSCAITTTPCPQHLVDARIHEMRREAALENLKSVLLDRLHMSSPPVVSITEEESAVLIERMKRCPSDCAWIFPNNIDSLGGSSSVGINEKLMAFGIKANAFPTPIEKKVISASIILKLATPLNISSDQFPLTVWLTEHKQTVKVTDTATEQVSKFLPNQTTDEFELDIRSMIEAWTRQEKQDRVLVVKVAMKNGEVADVLEVFKPNRNTQAKKNYHSHHVKVVFQPSHSVGFVPVNLVT